MQHIHDDKTTTNLYPISVTKQVFIWSEVLGNKHDFDSILLFIVHKTIIMKALNKSCVYLNMEPESLTRGHHPQTSL